MKHIISYNLFEAKSVGILYHYTSIKALEQILNTNTIRSTSRHYKSISFTRNKFFHRDPGFDVPCDARLILDGDKISERYKIQPYACTYPGDRNWKGDPDNIGRGVVEFEERMFQPLENLSTYLLGVEIAEWYYGNAISYEISKMKTGIYN